MQTLGQISPNNNNESFMHERKPVEKKKENKKIGTGLFVSVWWCLPLLLSEALYDKPIQA